ncbi:MAG: hypothetical protein M5U28_19750 [Sandaracinaceae bacterium]|nr:hypothetical protein [Sandaracinaceae bacterium]
MWDPFDTRWRVRRRRRRADSGRDAGRDAAIDAGGCRNDGACDDGLFCNGSRALRA